MAVILGSICLPFISTAITFHMPADAARSSARTSGEYCSPVSKAINVTVTWSRNLVRADMVAIPGEHALTVSLLRHVRALT